MRSSATLSTLVGLALLAAAGYALWYLARSGLGVLDGVDATVQLAAAGALTLVVCASIVAHALHALTRGEDGRQRRAARAATYEHVLRLHGARGPGALTDEERAVERLMLLYASPAVLNAYLRLRRAQEAGGARQELAELVRALRRDLGNRGAAAGGAELAELLNPSAPARGRVGTGGGGYG